jgi:hypothetical protein
VGGPVVDNPPGVAENARIVNGVRAVKALGSSVGRAAIPVVGALRPVAAREPDPNAPVIRLPAPAGGRPGAMRRKAPQRRN